MPTQNNDINTSPYGIFYTAPGQTWKVSKNVEVIGAVDGVHSDFASSTLINKGSIFAVYDIAVHFTGGGFSNHVLKNKASGTIDGNGIGAGFSNYSGSLMVQNKGTIKGVGTGLVSNGSTDVRIDNKGTISGGERGVLIDPTNYGSHDAVVQNHGTIKASGIGMFLTNNISTYTKIENYSDGKIAGGIAAIVSGGELNLKNEGKIKGAVVTDNYDDKIVNHQKIKGDVYLGGGDDVFKNKDKGKATGLD